MIVVRPRGSCIFDCTFPLESSQRSSSDQSCDLFFGVTSHCPTEVVDLRDEQGFLSHQTRLVTTSRTVVRGGGGCKLSVAASDHVVRQNMQKWPGALKRGPVGGQGAKCSGWQIFEKLRWLSAGRRESQVSALWRVCPPGVPSCGGSWPRPCQRVQLTRDPHKFARPWTKASGGPRPRGTWRRCAL